MSGIELAEVIQNLRDELAKAILDGEDQSIRFKPSAIDVEFAIEIKKSADLKAGVKFWVVDAGITGTAGQTQSHKIKLSLTMVDEKGKEILIGSNVTGRPGSRQQSTARSVATDSVD